MKRFVGYNHGRDIRKEARKRKPSKKQQSGKSKERGKPIVNYKETVEVGM